MAVRLSNFDQTQFRQALGRFATGVTIITTAHPDTGEPLGITVSSFNSLSMKPPLVLWNLQTSSSLLDVYQRVERYNIHVLSAEQMALAAQFSRGPQEQRFENVEYNLNEFGIPKLAEYCSAAWFECYNRSRYLEGDHLIMVGQVERCDHSDHMPLVFHAGSFDLTPIRSKTSKQDNSYE